jgi:predicted RNase H-like nuclease (RuvC/YqgF family)|tara:strand:+ start:2405 stop:2632 length:228 start_codon:yes stop_codon:yes gene_type:complete
MEGSLGSEAPQRETDEPKPILKIQREVSSLKKDIYTLHKDIIVIKNKLNMLLDSVDKNENVKQIQSDGAGGWWWA